MEEISKANILIVDDEPINLELLQDLLEMNDFKNVIPVNSAVKAYSALEDNSIDLIILDLLMPEVDGIEACKVIRNNSKYDHIPIIVATALVDLRIMESAFEAGADDYVRKPIANDLELVLRIQKALKTKMGTGSKLVG
jgi:sigma-B regulation protein RsbU (phosphoserine phosphatase)